MSVGPELFVDGPLQRYVTKQMVHIYSHEAIYSFIEHKIET